MDKDTLSRLVGAVRREVSTRDHEGAPARVITASRLYDTTIDDLWDALTNPERLPRWFGDVSGDLRLGGSYAIKGNASGEIVECAPPARLCLTWVAQGNTSWVKVELHENDPGKTELELEHIAHIPDFFWNQYGPGAGGVGWEIGLHGLAQHIVAASSAFDAEAWSTTDEGKLVIAGWSAGWSDAAIAAGADPSQAGEAGQRTTEFYTGG